MEDETPAAQLIAGSWLLNVPEHSAAAQSRLKSLAEGRDERVAALAVSQLWRLKLAGATAADVRRWETLLAKMPAKTRAGGWFMIARAHARLGEPKTAAAAAMRVPVHFPMSRSLAAESLLLAGVQLKKAGLASEAKSVFQEIVNDYATTTAAAIAGAELK